MADLWVPFVAAFIAAAAVLLVRQAVLTVSHRRTAQRTRPVAARVATGRAIIPARDPAVEMVRMPRVEITPGRPVSQARPFTPIIIGSPTTIPQPTSSPVIITAVMPPTAPTALVSEDMRVAVVPVADVPEPAAVAEDEPALEPEPVAAVEPVEVMASVASTETPPRRDTATHVEDDQSRRLRIAVGPGRPSTTIGAEAKVWSTWTQEVKAPESTPAQATAPAARDSGDEECPHCSSARYRGARFCGRCGRSLASAVTAS